MEQFLSAFLFFLVILSLKRSWDLQKQIKLQEEIMISLFEGRGVIYFIIEVERRQTGKEDGILEAVDFLRTVFDGRFDYVYVNDESVKPEEESFTQLIVVSYKYCESYDSSDVTQGIYNQLLESLPDIFREPVAVAFGRTAIEATNKLRVSKLNRAEDTVI
jgi:hypothetical protein